MTSKQLYNTLNKIYSELKTLHESDAFQDKYHDRQMDMKLTDAVRTLEAALYEMRG